MAGVFLFTGCGSNTPTDTTTLPSFVLKKATAEPIARKWYIRLVVEDVTNHMQTSSAEFGQLVSSNISKYALEALAPFQSNYLDVVFVNPPGVKAGSYKSDYHLSSSGADSWTFTVKSSDANATMLLSWRGLYILDSYVDAQNRVQYREHMSMQNPLLAYMSLTDLSTNTTIPVISHGDVNTYVFHMAGSNTRTFKWTLKDTSNVTTLSATPRDVSRKNVLNYNDKMKQLYIQALRKDAVAKPDRLKQKRLQGLDMLNPPKFKVLVP